MGERSKRALLMASIENGWWGPPPATGWQFFNWVSQTYMEDSMIRCGIADSSPCLVTVSLSGEAKTFQGECEGEYKDTGLKSIGRQVANSSKL